MRTSSEHPPPGQEGKASVPALGAMGNTDRHTKKCVSTCFEKMIQAQRERSLWAEVITDVSEDIGMWHLEERVIFE